MTSRVGAISMHEHQKIVKKKFSVRNVFERKVSVRKDEGPHKKPNGSPGIGGEPLKLHPHWTKRARGWWPN